MNTTFWRFFRGKSATKRVFVYVFVYRRMRSMTSVLDEVITDRVGV